LLGILAMGFIFDRFGAKSDEEQLQRLLVRNVRMLAQLVVSPVTNRSSRTGERLTRHQVLAVAQSRRLENQINDNFAGLESQADAARFEFEFRRRREQDAAECRRIQRVQPWLRSIYLLELSLVSQRGRREMGSELAQEQNRALDHFLNEYSDKLMRIAAWIANEEPAPPPISDDSIRLIRQSFEHRASANAQAIGDLCQKMAVSFLMLRGEC